MKTISVRLGEDDRRKLEAIQKATGRSASEAIRHAIKTESAGVEKAKPKERSFYDRYCELMDARKGEPAGPTTDFANNSREHVRAIIQAKHDRRSGRR